MGLDCIKVELYFHIVQKLCEDNILGKDYKARTHQMAQLDDKNDDKCADAWEEEDQRADLEEEDV